jgi:hypothetical protein
MAGFIEHGLIVYIYNQYGLYRRRIQDKAGMPRDELLEFGHPKGGVFPKLGLGGLSIWIGAGRFFNLFFAEGIHLPPVRLTFAAVRHRALDSGLLVHVESLSVPR